MNRILSIMIAVVFATAFFACSDDEDSTTVTPNPSGSATMSAKIDGVTWTGIGYSAALDSTGTLAILANGVSGSDTSLITISTEAPQGGPFVIDTTSSDNSASYNLLFPAVSGTITISAHNANTNVVSGTFNFQTTDLFGTSAGPAFTEGIFNNITYTE